MTRLLFLTSNLQLPPPTVYIWRWRAGLEVGKPNNIPANNRRASNGHSQRGQRKNYSDEHLNFFCNLCQVLVCPKCTPDGHKDHPWVLLKWETATEMLQALVTQGRSKLEKSQEDSQALESALSELQEQTLNAKGLITETFLSTFIYARAWPKST